MITRCIVTTLCVAIASAGVLKQDNCFMINGSYYSKEVLKTSVDRPYLFAVDRSTNDLYFSTSITKDGDDFKTGFVNIDDRSSSYIDEVRDGFAQAVDDKTFNIYIGGSDGVYIYDRGVQTCVPTGVNGTNIWSMFYKDALYYTTYPEQSLYKFENDKSEKVQEYAGVKIDLFVIDNDNDRIFTNITGLYGPKVEKNGKVETVLYEPLPKIGARGLTVDKNGNTFVCLNNGIYFVDKKYLNLKKYFDIDDGFAVAFDKNNNLVYGDADSIVLMKPQPNC